jgi:hypothetical protein
MTVPNLPELSLGYLTVTPSRDGDALVLRMVGTADMRAMESLDRFLRSAHGAARTLRVPEAVVDMRGLEFMNSSCFKTFVTWIESLVETPPESRYRIRFLSSPERGWQKRSLTALSYFAPDLITVG